MADPTDPADPKPALAPGDGSPSSAPVEPVAPDRVTSVAPTLSERIALRSAPSPRPPAAPEPAPQPLPLHGAQVIDSMFDPAGAGLGERLWPTIVYLMMLLAVLTLGLGAVPAALLCLRWRDDPPEWIGDHYRYMLRSFIGGAVLMVLAAITFLFFDAGRIGVVAGAAWAVLLVGGLVWFITRNTLGLIRLWNGEAPANWRTWTI